MPPRFVRQLRNNTAQSLVLHTQGLPHVKNKRTCVRVIKMKTQFLARGKKEHKNQKANDYNKLQSLQNGLVCDVSSAFGVVAAVAAPIPSSKSYSQLISMPRISFRFGRNPKNFVILRVSKDLVETKRQTFLRPHRNY